MSAIWATPSDVVDITGVTATPEQVARAQTTLELHTGLVATDAVGMLNTRDQHWLKLATAYQTAWLLDQPDAFLRNDVSSASQDGVSATFRPDGLTLAPMAKRTLKRLSWRGTRTLRPRVPVTDGAYPLIGGYGEAYGQFYSGAGNQGRDEDIPPQAWKAM